MNYHCDLLANRKSKSLIQPTKTHLQVKPLATTAMLRTSEGFLTGRVRSYIYQKEYREETRERLRVSDQAMGEIDWQTLRSVLKKKKFPPSVLKLIWEDNPSMTRLKEQRRAHSSACPLCGDRDDPSHFLSCKRINGSIRWKDIKTNFQTKSGVIKVPGHLVRSTTSAMEGTPVSSAVHVGMRGRVYRGQEEIRWANFIRGRVHKEWHTLQKRELGAEQIPPSAWQFGLVESVLQLLANKWTLRCDMVKKEEQETERTHLTEEYGKLRNSPQWKELGRGDIYLTEERYRPDQRTPIGVLRELVRTCKSACGITI